MMRPKSGAWERVENNRVSDQVVEQVISLMKEGHLRPGDKLPPETELMKILGVGRSTIREAKRTLVSMKLIESGPGRGSFVRPPDARSIVASDLAYLWLADETAVALHQTRELLEPSIAEFVARNLRQDDISKMSAVLREMEASVKGGLSFYRLGMDFHRALVQACHNPVVESLYEPIIELLYEHQRPVYEKHVDPEEELQEHVEIFRALVARDPERARRTMQEHLRHVRSVTASALTRMMGEAGRPGEEEGAG